MSTREKGEYRMGAQVGDVIECISSQERRVTGRKRIVAVNEPRGYFDQDLNPVITTPGYVVYEEES